MLYLSEDERWSAYEFNDPFATGSFFVCNKQSNTFCRPDCSLTVTEAKSNVLFVLNLAEALNMGFTECTACDPLSSTPADLTLLMRCVSSVNAQIGFSSPLSSPVTNEHHSAGAERQQPKSEFVKLESQPRELGSSELLSKEVTLSKNDLDHLKIVDLACRHLASAAALALFSSSSSSSQSQGTYLSSDETCVSPTNTRDPLAHTKTCTKKRRRGGVLGFKELASKLKLLAWHFHRVFKLVTGLTPKMYGDKCWEHLRSEMDKDEVFLSKPLDYRRYTMNKLYPAIDSAAHTPPSLSSLSTPTSPENSAGSFKKMRLQQLRVNTLLHIPQERLSSPKPQQDHYSLLNFGVNGESDQVQKVSYEVPQADSFEFGQSFNMFSTDQPRAHSAPDIKPEYANNFHDGTGLDANYLSAQNNTIGFSRSFQGAMAQSPLDGEPVASGQLYTEDYLLTICGVAPHVYDFNQLLHMDLQYQHESLDILTLPTVPHVTLPQEDVFGKPLLGENHIDPGNFDTFNGMSSVKGPNAWDSAWTIDYLSANTGA